MSLLISPTEPKKIRALGKVTMVPEDYGADVLITELGNLIGIQRKVFPEDFMTSIADGRLFTQIQQSGKLDQFVIVLEGMGEWTEDGTLIAKHQSYRGFTKQGFHGLLFTIMFVYGVPVLQVKSMRETIDLIETLRKWAGKEKHSSLRTRPGPPKGLWGTRDDSAWGAWLLQSLPGVGPELADRMIEHFNGVPLSWDVGVKELMEVPGVGKKKAEQMYKTLERGGGNE